MIPGERRDRPPPAARVGGRLATVEAVRGRRLLSVAAAAVMCLLACGGGDDTGTAADRPADAATTTTTSAPDPGSTAPSTAPATPPLTRPDWLGTRVLPDGAPPPPTPPELDPRILPTVDALPPPADGAFHATMQPVPADVVARSTWQEACPVTLDELRYVTVSFWGFDDTAHTGELIVHRDAADGMVQVFEQLFAARFPIEDMRVSTMADLDAPNTGDGNTTAAFVCRPTRGSSRWSEHAYGLAVDVNPFQNPYVRDGGRDPRAWPAATSTAPTCAPACSCPAPGRSRPSPPWAGGGAGSGRTRGTTCTSAPTGADAPTRRRLSRRGRGSGPRRPRSGARP